MAKIDFIVVHCSASKPGANFNEDTLRRIHQGPKDIGNGKVRWQGKEYKSRNSLPDIVFHGVHLRKVKGNGWSQVGYYAMVEEDGNVVQLVDNNLDDYVDPWEITNGAKGYNNRAIHVMYVGGIDDHGKPKDTRTELQDISLVNLLTMLRQAAPNAKILGHRDLPGVAKACPSFDVKKEYGWI